MDAADVRAAVERLCQVNLVYTKHDVREMRTLCEVSKRHLRDKVAAHLRQTCEEPLLTQYWGDGWGCKVREHMMHKSVDDLVVRTHGRVRLEFNIERVMLVSTDPSGAPRKFMLFGDPRPMADGRKAWNFFTAAHDFFLPCASKDIEAGLQTYIALTG